LSCEAFAGTLSSADTTVGTKPTRVAPNRSMTFQRFGMTPGLRNPIGLNSTNVAPALSGAIPQQYAAAAWNSGRPTGMTSSCLIRSAPATQAWYSWPSCVCCASLGSPVVPPV